jgi:hypothetical protein
MAIEAVLMAIMDEVRGLCDIARAAAAVRREKNARRILLAVFAMSERHGWVSPGLAEWLLEAPRVGLDVDVIFKISDWWVWVGRNEVAEHALTENFGWCCQVDSDQIPPQNFFELLQEADSRGIEIFGCTTPMWRGSEIVPNTVGARNYPHGASGPLVEVDAVGTGVFAFRVSVLAKLPSPWFETRSLRMKNGEIESEDWNFCRKARQAGISVFATASMNAGHLKTVDLLHLPAR